MIRAGAALSHTEETEEAAEEATLAALERAGMDEADWVLLFATPHHRPAYSRMLGAAAATAGTHRIIGCSGVGVLTHEGEIESGPGISVLVVASDTVRASPFLLQTLDHWSGLAGIRREEETRDASDLVVLLPDPVGAPIESLLRTIERSIGGVSIVGAAPSEDGTLGGTYQFCGEEAVSGGVAGIHLSGGFETTIGVTQACQPIGEPCIITRSAGGTVHQLDGRPAFTVLRDQLPRPLADDLASALPYISAGVAAGHGGSVER